MNANLAKKLIKTQECLELLSPLLNYKVVFLYFQWFHVYKHMTFLWIKE
jgi:hypothetical protein